VDFLIIVTNLGIPGEMGRRGIPGDQGTLTPLVTERFSRLRSIF
jgi:hypothetical protein